MRYNLPPDEGKKKRNRYWNAGVVLGIIAIIVGIIDINDDGRPPRGEYVTIDQYQWYECANGDTLFDPDETLENDGTRDCSDGSDERTNDSEVWSACAGLMCCGSLIFVISALSTKNDTSRVVVVQQQPQYVPVVQQVVQRPVQPRFVAQPHAPPMRAAPPATPVKNKSMWIQEARNLELARNWEEAAKAYEKAGMYAEAGRIRKEHLEDKQPIVKIGKVGDTILHDSVMISDESENDV